MTASAATGGGTASGDVAGWFDLGLIHRLLVVANSDTKSVVIRFYADAAHTVLLYEATAVDAFSGSGYEDLVPFHYRDVDVTAKLHYQITNNGTNASAFTLTLAGIGA